MACAGYAACLVAGMSNIFSRLLVAIDMSSCSQAALSLGLKLAQFHSAQLEVVHAANEASSALHGELQSFVAAALTEGQPMPSIHLTVGQPHQVILNHAERMGCDLIVLGTHGRTGRARNLAGSVAENVVRASTCPVITVRDRA